MTAGIVLSSYYKSNEDIEKDWTALTTVKSSLASVSEGLVRNALLSDIQDDYQALIESKKEKAVDSVYKKIKKLVDESGYDFSVNGDGAVVNSSAGYSYDNFESFYSSEIDRSITYNVSTADFDFHGYEAYAPETTFYYFPDKADSYAELYSDIEYAYDSFVTEKTEVFSYLYDVYYDYVGASFCVLKDGEVVNQNVTDITEQNITEKQYYLIVENGEITVSPEL